MRERLQVGTDTRSTRRILDSFLALVNMLHPRSPFPQMEKVAAIIITVGVVGRGIIVSRTLELGRAECVSY